MPLENNHDTNILKRPEFVIDESRTDILSCPPSGASIEINPGTHTIKFSNNGSLCTLTKREDDTVFGVARSYGGNSWEIAAGEFASSFFL